jgi:peptide/nickel transport system substrate-binding protein
MGAFRAGPPIPEFDQILDRYVRQTDGAELNALDEQMDRLAHAQALSLFLCAPQALYAVNKHVSFVGHATTFEVAETEVSEGHWSRRQA